MPIDEWWDDESFNPLPAVKPGDTDCKGDWRAIFRSFNPLPAVKPGDTKTQAQMISHLQVSIRSRRLSREIHLICALTNRACKVSIRSRRLSREIPEEFSYRKRGQYVSIRSRRLSREIHSAAILSCDYVMFQSAPGG